MVISLFSLARTELAAFEMNVDEASPKSFNNCANTQQEVPKCEV